MSVRTMVELPEPLHEALRRRAEESGASIDAVILRTLEAAIGDAGQFVTGPFITEGGQRGPLYPTAENPHDLILP
jgi:hypothetical protein